MTAARRDAAGRGGPLFGGLSKLPLRVIRGVIRRIRPGGANAPEVKLPIRTDPEGPNLKPSVARSAAEAPAAKVEAPAAKAEAPVAAPSKPAPVAEAHSAPVAEPDPVGAATATGASDADSGKSKGKKAGKAKKDAKSEAEAAPEPATAAPPAAATAPVRVRGEPTPNPNAMKFSCSVKVIPKGSVTFNTPTAAAGHKVGEPLFQVTGVRSVFAVNDFVTVTKEDAAAWSTLVPKIEAALVSALSA